MNRDAQPKAQEDSANGLSVSALKHSPQMTREQFKLLANQLQQLLASTDPSALSADLSQDISATSFHRRLLLDIISARAGDAVNQRDELTGLLTRSSLLQQLKHDVSASRVDSKIVAVCFIDLDGFKAMNDQHGHAVGDLVLAAVGSRITACIRPTDLACRWGGDEFIVAFKDIQGKALMMQLATRLLSMMTEPMQLSPDNPMRLFLGASIGVTLTTELEVEASELIAQADQAMYLAKKAGKNCIEFYR